MKIINKNKRLALFFLLPIFLLMLGSSVISNTHAADDGNLVGEYIEFHGIKLDKNTQLEAYGLNIQFMNQSYKLNTWSIEGLNNSWNRGKKAVTLICTFPNLKIKDEKTNKNYIFRVLLNTTLDLPASSMFKNKRVYFTENVEVSLSNNYYKYFKILEKAGTLDFTGMQVSIFYDGKSKSIYKNGGYKGDFYLNFPSNLTSYNVPVDVIDPTNPDFDLDFGNTGTNQSPNEDVKPWGSMNFWERIVAAFKAVFFGFGGFVDYAIVVVVIIVCLFVISLLVRLLKSIF